MSFSFAGTMCLILTVVFLLYWIGLDWDMDLTLFSFLCL